MGGRINENATMDVRSYEAGQHKKLKNKGTTPVGEITKKVKERRLTWYGHMMRREERFVGWRAVEMKVYG